MNENNRNKFQCMPNKPLVMKKKSEMFVKSKTFETIFSLRNSIFMSLGDQFLGKKLNNFLETRASHTHNHFEVLNFF